MTASCSSLSLYFCRHTEFLAHVSLPMRAKLHLNLLSPSLWIENKENTLLPLVARNTCLCAVPVPHELNCCVVSPWELNKETWRMLLPYAILTFTHPVTADLPLRLQFTLTANTDNIRTTIPVTVGHTSDDNICVSMICDRLMQNATYTSC
jgi:hypothetical protein